MAKDKKKKPAKKKKKAIAHTAPDVDFEDEVEPMILVVDDEPELEAPAARKVKKAAPNGRVAVGERFWLVPKGHRRKARPVCVASVLGDGDSVTIQCLDNGEKRVLPLAAFATAGTSRVLRA